MDGSEEEECLNPVKRYRGQRGPNKVKKPTMPLVGVRLPSHVLEHFSGFENATGQIRRVLVEHVAGIPAYKMDQSTDPIELEIEPLTPNNSGSNCSTEDFAVSLSGNVSTYYAKFPSPAKMMEEILQWYAVQYGGVIVEDDNNLSAQDAPIIDIDYMQVAPHEIVLRHEDAYSKLRHILLRGNERLEGYGSLRHAAISAVRDFGTNWLETEVSSPGYPIRMKLRDLVFNNLPSGYSNKSVAWGRFQKYAREHAIV